DWSSDVCSSDLGPRLRHAGGRRRGASRRPPPPPRPVLRGARRRRHARGDHRPGAGLRPPAPGGRRPMTGPEQDPGAGPAAMEGAGAAPAGVGEDLDRVLRHLELTVTRRLDGLLRGAFPSASSGPGSDPDSAREYVVGDDVRMMDWSVTARTGVAHVRDPEAERELECWICVDSAPRLGTGSGTTTKRHLLAAATAAVTFLNDNPGDRTALLSDGVVTPPGQGRAHAMRLIASAARHVGAAGLAVDLASLQSRAPRAGLVVVISDFLGD